MTDLTTWPAPLNPPTFANAADGDTVTLRGMLVGVVDRLTFQGRQWATAILECGDGGVHVEFLPKVYEACSNLIVEDGWVAVTGIVDRRPDEPVLSARKVEVS